VSPTFSFFSSRQKPTRGPPPPRNLENSPPSSSPPLPAIRARPHSAEFEGFSSDETVRVVMSGSQEPRSVDITEEAAAQGAERLSALVSEAMKDAHSKSVEGMKVRMSAMAKSLGLGGPGGGLGL